MWGNGVLSWWLPPYTPHFLSRLGTAHLLLPYSSLPLWPTWKSGADIITQLSGSGYPLIKLQPCVPLPSSLASSLQTGERCTVCESCFHSLFIAQLHSPCCAVPELWCFCTDPSNPIPQSVLCSVWAPLPTTGKQREGCVGAREKKTCFWMGWEGKTISKRTMRKKNFS